MESDESETSSEESIPESDEEKTTSHEAVPTNVWDEAVSSMCNGVIPATTTTTTTAATSAATTATASTTGAQSAAALTAAAPTAVPPSAAHSEWENAHQKTLDKQEEAERAKREELRSTGAAYLSKFYAERQQTVSARKSANREAERAAQVVAASTPGGKQPLGSSQEESWARVCDLIDFSKDGVQRDTSRMKHILLQLKTSPIPAENSF